VQTALPIEFKRGQVLLLDGIPHVIEELRVSGTAKTKHKLHAFVRNLHSGHVFERTFPDNERVPTAELEFRRVTFSYSQGDRFTFLDADTFEELPLTGEQLGDRRFFLKENVEYRALFLEGRLLDIVLPDTMTLKVLETAPAQHGGGDSTWKPAHMEGGLTVMVPLFIASGEALLIDTKTRKYAGKAG
jgi:elongation factor P